MRVFGGYKRCLAFVTMAGTSFGGKDLWRETALERPKLRQPIKIGGHSAADFSSPGDSDNAAFANVFIQCHGRIK